MTADPFAAPAPPTSSRPSSVTFSSFLSRFSEVEDESDGYAVVCPAHADHTPSLRVAYNADSRKIALHCRAGCKTEAVTEALGLSLRDLFNVEPGDEVLLRTVGTQAAAPSTGDRAVLAFYLSRAAAALAAPALDYVSRRFGISEERAVELGLGYDDGTLDGGILPTAEGARPRRLLSPAKYHDAPRVVVPFLTFDGLPHYLQARAVTSDYSGAAKWSGPTNPEGAAWGRYGFLRGGTGWGEVIVTEGPGDGLTSAAAGYDTVLIRGAALGDDAAMADEIAAALKGRRVIVAGDEDKAGRRFTRDVCNALSERGIDTYRLGLPSGVTDLTDWREEAGSSFAKAFVRAVEEAPRYGTDQIVAEEISQDVARLFSDVYNANALLDSIRDRGADVRFSPEVGFIVYRPELGTWKIDVEEWIRSQAQTIAYTVQRSILASMSSMDARVSAISDASLREQIGKVLDSQRKKARSGSLVSYVMSTKGIDSMLRELRALEGVFASFESFDKDETLLAVANGVVDLETGTLRPYSAETKDLYLMRRVDVPYVPGARCPRWEEFVREIFAHFPDDPEHGPHAGLPAFLQRLVGYGITGHTTEQALAVLYGGGSNGKGVLIETLTGIFKGITVTTPFSTFEQKPSGGIPNDIAALKGSRLVMASEGEQGRQMAESLIKRLTGGDTISARFMRKEFFEFVPTFLIVLATNYKPNFRGQDFGLWRRVKLIPFTRTFSAADRDTHLTSKFLGRRVPRTAYRPGEDYGDGPAGILAWAVEGARLWYEIGLSPPPVVSNATEEFKETSDKLGDFYDHYLVKDEEGRISGKEVWMLYREWADEEDLPSKERWTRSTFWGALEERGARKTKSGRSIGFRGIRRRRPSEGGHHEEEEDRAPSDDPAHFLNTAPAATPFSL